MKDLLVLLAHLLITIARLLGLGGAKAIVADSLLMKQQLLIVSRSRRRAPNLTAIDRMLLGFSHSGLGNGNSYNESLSVEDDSFSLFLKPIGMARMVQDIDEQLTPEGAAEYYWGLFIERLQ